MTQKKGLLNTLTLDDDVTTQEINRAQLAALIANVGVSPMKLITAVEGIDFTSAGVLGGVIPGNDTIIEIVTFYLTAAGTITVAPQVSIGTNSTPYDNILPPTTLTGLDSTTKKRTQIIQGVAATIPDGSDASVNISTPATAGSMVGTLLVWGYDYG